MKCPHCGAAARSGTLFCEQCGSKLEKVCHKCAATLPVEARFCGACGQAVAELSGPVASAGPGDEHFPPEATSERRHITVMFCDLVGSTALSERLDPEHLREVLGAYQNLCADAIACFDGYLARSVGDGILAYFGYPRAHEDDARRAVHAALLISRDIARLKTDERDQSIKLAVRIGIHTGLVVAGEMGARSVRESHAIVGVTPNLAARLQELAAPNNVLISEATFHLVERYFECRSLGPHALKGLAHPIPVFEARFVRAEPERDRHVLPIGRDQELAFLLGHWQRVSNKEGQAVLLSGEAGIGKSCLLDALKDRVVAEGGSWLACQCSPYDKNSVLHPAVDLITHAMKLTDEQPASEKLAKIATALRRHGLATPENVAMYAALLSIPTEANYRLPEMAPAERRLRIMGALIAWLTAEAQAQKMLFIVEDLHWADASTADFLGLVLEQLATLPILAVFAFRPDFIVPWAPRSHISTLALGRLGREAAQAITARVSGRKRLPSPVVEQILVKTDGIPLFVEELTKMVLGSGLLIEQDDHYQLAGALPPLAIPTTLRDSLMARLDRLGGERHAMQMAAVFGREFRFQMLQAALGTDADRLDRDLAALVQAEILYRRGLPPAATYFFKHALVHDTAYETLLKSTRQQYHARVAEVYEDQFPEAARARPEVVALHFTQAGLGKRAVPYWRAAGELASKRSGYTEAIHHFSAALDLVRALPDEAGRAETELDVSVKLGMALIVSKGPATPEVEALYQRADEVGRSLGDSPQRLPVLHGLWYHLYSTGHIGKAVQKVDEMMSLAERLGDNDLLLEANHAQWATSLYRGLVPAVCAATAQGIARYDSTRHHVHLYSVTGHDSGVCARLTRSIALWLAGFPDQAQQMAAAAVQLGRDLSHPFSLCWGLWGAGITYQLCGARDACAEVADEVRALSDEHQFVVPLAMGQILCGWTLADGGNVVHGIELMQQGIDNLRAQRRVAFIPYGLTLQAAARAQLGAFAEAQTLIEEGTSLVQETGQGAFVSELYRLRGELLWMISPSRASEAADAFLTAIAIAERQSAVALRFRAEMSLARLRASADRQAEAKSILTKGYRHFTEGFQTRDLRAARVLLESL